jgi:parvulin-like peptidyl-prolyl isomerase
MPREVLPVLTALLLTACAASNPAAPTQPAAWQPPPQPAKPAEPAAPPKAAEPATSAQSAVAPAPAAQDQAKPAAQGPAAPAPAATPPSGAEPIVATVAGKPVYVSELLAQWLYSDSLQVLEQLDNLAVGRLVVTEATRLGVRIQPELASAAYERGVQAIEKEIQGKRPGMTLDRYVDQFLGLDPIRYRERLRDDALRSLLGERVVRGWLLQNEHAFLRVIVVQSEEDAKAVQADLASGTAFPEVAEKRSKDESRKQGGRIAPIVKGDTPIGRVAFTTDVGKVGGPVQESGRWLFVLVEKRGLPLEGDWTVLGPAVEASLGEQRVDELELQQWKKSMRERYDVDLKPFLRLVGEPGH